MRRATTDRPAELVHTAEPRPRLLVLDLSAVGDADTTTAAVLGERIDELEVPGVEVRFAAPTELARRGPPWEANRNRGVSDGGGGSRCERIPVVTEAFLWGLLAGSSLLIGAVLALTVPIRERVHGWIMAFGAGVLISAVAFELVEDAFETSAWSGSLALGLFAGCAAFTLGDALIDRMGGAERKVMHGGEETGSPLAIVLGIVLDGIPESMVIGLTLLEGGAVSAAVIVAVFLSNLPEAVAATSGLRDQGRSPRWILGLWALIVLVSALASLAGYGLFDGAPPDTVAFVLAFAGGAILTMLADTMMPEAFRHGGRLVGFFTTVGFGVAFAVSMLE